MADTISTTPSSGLIHNDTPDRASQYRVQEQPRLWHRLALGAIILIAIFMDFFQLGQNGFATYYPPAVRSMMDNWHNFFFASYDPGGFVTVDKPPLGFWLQVLSSKIFGFSPFSVLVPQALAGVLSVLLLYYLVKTRFGIVAGLLAALALALFPISVVTNRNITIDSTLALTILIGAWAVLRAAETGKLRWLLLAAVIVGIGFNIKMMEAYLVVPAYGVLYLVAAPRTMWTRIGHLALAGLVLLVVSFSWPLAVDLTPPSQRPYVGSTQDNSEISLALGYNGIDRLLRGFGRGRGFAPTGAGRPANTSGTGGTTVNNGGGAGGTRGTANNRGNGFPNNGSPNNGSANGGRNANQQPQNGGFGGPFDTGSASPLRLFNEPLGGQIAWLLPLAFLGILAVAWRRRPRLQEDRQQQSVVFWGMWLLTMFVFFSIAGFFHQYYMTVMAPSIAALFGIGIVTMWQDYREGGWRGWLLPIAILLTLVEQIHLLSSYPTWSRWIVPIITVASVLVVGWLVIARVAPRLRLVAPSARTLVPMLGLGVLTLMFTPTLWAVLPVIQNSPALANNPIAGPAQMNDFGGGGNRGAGRGEQGPIADPKLISYLEANQGNAKFLVATPSSMSADGIILATNKPVMAMGGFSGSDPILTTSQLASLVSNGTVRFFLLSNLRQIPQQILNRLPQQFRNALRNGNFGAFGGFGQQLALTNWVQQHCKQVPTAQWQSAGSSSGNGGGFGGFGRGGANVLYDCSAAHA